MSTGGLSAANKWTIKSDSGSLHSCTTDLCETWEALRLALCYEVVNIKSRLTFQTSFRVKMKVYVGLNSGMSEPEASEAARYVYTHTHLYFYICVHIRAGCALILAVVAIALWYCSGCCGQATASARESHCRRRKQEKPRVWLLKLCCFLLASLFLSLWIGWLSDCRCVSEGDGGDWVEGTTDQWASGTHIESVCRPQRCNCGGFCGCMCVCRRSKGPQPSQLHAWT